MLVLLSLGPHKVKNMDIYLEPLIEELKFLWRGIQIHDISHPIAACDAIVKGILMWANHDYPSCSKCSSEFSFYYLLIRYISVSMRGQLSLNFLRSIPECCF